MRHLGNRGDTIVEVLIAIAVISSVLGGAFVSANRSLNGGRQSQERSEAVKLMESQLEQLKVAASAGAIFNNAPVFCLQDTAKIDISDINNLGGYPAACRQGTSSRYHVSLERQADNRTFRAKVLWDKAGADGQDEASVVYRVYP